MKKSFLALALLASTAASAQVHVEVTGLFKDAELTEEAHATFHFDGTGDEAEVVINNGTFRYKLVDSDEETVTLEVEIERESTVANEEGDSETVTEVVGKAVITTEWDKEGLIRLEDGEDSVSLTITAHNE